MSLCAMQVLFEMCSVCKSLLASHGKSGCCRPRRRRVGQRWGNLKLGVERLHVEVEMLVSIVNNKLENSDHGGTTLHTFGILRKSAHKLASLVGRYKRQTAPRYSSTILHKPPELGNDILDSKLSSHSKPWLLSISRIQCPSTHVALLTLYCGLHSDGILRYHKPTRCSVNLALSASSLALFTRQMALTAMYLAGRACCSPCASVL